jgi:hypothetical protein
VVVLGVLRVLARFAGALRLAVAGTGAAPGIATSRTATLERAVPERAVPIVSAIIAPAMEFLD